MITADRVSFAYDAGPALTEVTVTACPGRILGLIGPNGSGKTTLLRTLYGALRPGAGQVLIDQDPVESLSTRQVAQRLAVVAQEPASEMPISVADMTLLGRSPHRSSLQRYTTHDHRLASQALQRVGARHLANRSYSALSGGERQRVLIARSLVQATDHLLLDEPTNHLDIRYQHEILQLVRGLGTTTVLVLHDLNLAARYCDELVLLDGGAVARTGPPETVLAPEVLEPIYQIGIQRLVENGYVQLLFQPQASQAAVNTVS